MLLLSAILKFLEFELFFWNLNECDIEVKSDQMQYYQQITATFNLNHAVFSE